MAFQPFFCFPDLTASQLRTTFDGYTGPPRQEFWGPTGGYELRSLSAYGFPGSEKFAAVFLLVGEHARPQSLYINETLETIDSAQFVQSAEGRYPCIITTAGKTAEATRYSALFQPGQPSWIKFGGSAVTGPLGQTGDVAPDGFRGDSGFAKHRTWMQSVDAMPIWVDVFDIAGKPQICSVYEDVQHPDYVPDRFSWQVTCRGLQSTAQNAAWNDDPYHRAMLEGWVRPKAIVPWGPLLQGTQAPSHLMTFWHGSVHSPWPTPLDPTTFSGGVIPWALTYLDDFQDTVTFANQYGLWPMHVGAKTCMGRDNFAVILGPLATPDPLPRRVKVTDLRGMASQIMSAEQLRNVNEGMRLRRRGWKNDRAALANAAAASCETVDPDVMNIHALRRIEADVLDGDESLWHRREELLALEDETFWHLAQRGKPTARREPSRKDTRPSAQEVDVATERDFAQPKPTAASRELGQPSRGKAPNTTTNPTLRHPPTSGSAWWRFRLRSIAQLEEHLIQALRRSGARMVQLCVAKNGRCVYCKSFTHAEDGYPDPRPDQNLHVASVEKALVGMAILNLVGGASIGLPLTQALGIPGNPTPVNQANLNAVTLLDLVHMRDGFNINWEHIQSRLQEVGLYQGRLMPGDFSRYLPIATQNMFLDPPTEKYRYSNQSFDILGEVVGKIRSGDPQSIDNSLRETLSVVKGAASYTLADLHHRLISWRASVDANDFVMYEDLPLATLDPLDGLTRPNVRVTTREFDAGSGELCTSMFELVRIVSSLDSRAIAPPLVPEIDRPWLYSPHWADPLGADLVGVAWAYAPVLGKVPIWANDLSVVDDRYLDLWRNGGWTTATSRAMHRFPRFDPELPTYTFSYAFNVGVVDYINAPLLFALIQGADLERDLDGDDLFELLP